jgi:hypothetical protein
MAVAALIKELDGTLHTVCLPKPNTDRLREMALVELLDGVELLQATVLTASGMTDRLGSGVTTASCGLQSMERPHTEVPRTRGPGTRRRMPISVLSPLRKSRRFFGLKPTPTWLLCTFWPRRWKDMEGSKLYGLLQSSVFIGSSCWESDLPLHLLFKRSRPWQSLQLSEYLRSSRHSRCS